MPQKVFSFRLPAATLMVIGLLPSLVFTQDGKNSGAELIVRGVPGGRLDPLRKSSRKYVNVFGAHVFATEKTPDSKVLHAATILAEYLDNDEHGKPDNQIGRAHV